MVNSCRMPRSSQFSERCATEFATAVRSDALGNWWLRAVANYSMSVKNLINIPQASDFCFIKYLKPKREKTSYISIIQSTPPAVGLLDPNRSPNTC